MQAKLSGNIIAGPAEGVSNGFASMTLNDQLSFQPSGDQGIAFQVATGVLTCNVSTASPSWRTLAGVGGAADAVSQGNLLYAKSNGQMFLRITFENGSDPDIVSIYPLNGGPLIMPIDPARYLKLLEVQGSGQLLYFVCGNS
jgi:hypothetical protein